MIDRMTIAEFEAEREKIREVYGDPPEWSARMNNLAVILADAASEFEELAEAADEEFAKLKEDIAELKSTPRIGPQNQTCGNC
jgi:hypothetical protein